MANLTPVAPDRWPNVRRPAPAGPMHAATHREIAELDQITCVMTKAFRRIGSSHVLRVTLPRRHAPQPRAGGELQAAAADTGRRQARCSRPLPRYDLRESPAREFTRVGLKSRS